MLTILDDEGSLLEADQRALVRHVVQEGAGADIIFSAGTTGEWDKIDNDTRQAVIRVCAEEVAKTNRQLTAMDADGVEHWAGVTAPTAHETLANLEFALECGADAAVIAPLSIQGVSDPVRFMLRDVADLLDARARHIPIFLYDNADIAVDPKVPHIRTKQVKAMSRLDFVRGIKVSASDKVLGNYTRAASSFKDRGEFGIYIGNAKLIFDIFQPYRPGIFGVIHEHWDRWRRSGGLPVGVVVGSGQRDAAGMGLGLAGLPRGRRGADGRGAARGRRLPRLHDARLGQAPHPRLPEARPRPRRRDHERLRRAGNPRDSGGRGRALRRRVRRGEGDGRARDRRSLGHARRAEDGMSEARDLELVGIGSMVIDRMHRTRRVLAANEKGLLESDPGAGPVRTCIGGLMLNQLGWAALFGVPVGIFGRQAEDDAGRQLRRAMAAHGIATNLDLTGSASSLAEIFVDGEGERAIYMAAGATAETRPEHIRRDHADFIARARRLTTEISQLPLDTTLAALELAHASGLSTVVDLDVLPSDAVATLGDRETFDAVLRAGRSPEADGGGGARAVSRDDGSRRARAPRCASATARSAS